jgi:hypothetical protein
MRKYLICLALAVGLATLTGCPPERPKAVELNTPPIFGKGDQVAVRESQQIGLVLKVYKPNGDKKKAWYYTVAFRENEMDYPEPDLRLVERMNWNRPITKGEVEAGPVKVDP